MSRLKLAEQEPDQCPSGPPDGPAVGAGNAEGSRLADWLEARQHQDGPRSGADAVVAVDVSALSGADSPRIAGESAEHLETLAAAGTELPPIIVHYPTMRVIDGMHRLRLAQSRGDAQILARFFCGNDADAFVVGVKANIAHGLPLSLADRRTAAIRILASHHHWSDRMIASVTGLAAKTIANLRRRSGGAPSQTAVRVGRDGRIRPVNGAEGRMIAYQLMTDDPSLSLRKVAQAAGISPETVRDVRNRLRLGQGPVPKRFEKPAKADRPETRRLPDRRAAHVRLPGDCLIGKVERLKADPSLWFTETGRRLLRLMYAQFSEAAGWEKTAANVPPHCTGTIAELAQECADMWQELAAELLERKVAESALTPDPTWAPRAS